MLSIVIDFFVGKNLPISCAHVVARHRRSFPFSQWVRESLNENHISMQRICDHVHKRVLQVSARCPSQLTPPSAGVCSPHKSKNNIKGLFFWSPNILCANAYRDIRV